MDNGVKVIPDKDFLFLRIHKNHVFDNDKIMPIAFRNHEGGMSTDWSEYSTSEESRQRVRSNGKDPNNYGIVTLQVGSVRNIENQAVIHSPLPDNYSHADVTGEKSDKARLFLMRISTWEIRVHK